MTVKSYEEIREIEANAFACELLMPKEWVKNAVAQEVKEHGRLSEDSVDRLAEKFGVSVFVMTARLMYLKYIKL